jgi:DHA1 family multidrug resistance protein-like MFS transporter
VPITSALPSVNWRRDLGIIAFAQFLTIVGFFFVNPFMPVFLKKLGGLTSEEAAFWGGIAIAASPLAIFLSTPVWGFISDRWGRKPMVLRSMLGCGVIIVLTSFAPNIGWVIVLRFLMGISGGSVAAAAALAASRMPRERLPFGLSMLTMSIFLGSSLGPLMGGMVADHIGFEGGFYITGGLMVMAGLLVHFTIKEHFVAPPPEQRIGLGDVLILARSRKMLPLLVAIAILQIGPSMILPEITLLLQQMEPAGAAATLSGLALCGMNGLGSVSSLVFARISSRVSLKKALVYCCIGCAVLNLPPYWAATTLQLILLIALTGLFSGGLTSSSNSIIGLASNSEKLGVAFGLGQCANALGTCIGLVIGGSLGSWFGLRAVFPITAAIFLVVAVIIHFFLQEVRATRRL